MPQLALWDTDHTLIATCGVGRQLSAAAFEEVTGQAMRRQAKIDGITEAVIFREIAKLHGIPADRSDFERFAAALTAQHVQRAGELRERGHALPGAAAALDALAAAGLRQTVVTPALAQYQRPPPGVLTAQRKERARVRSEKGIRWGGRPLNTAA